MNAKYVILLIVVLACLFLLISFISWTESYTVKEVNKEQVNLMFLSKISPFFVGLLIGAVVVLFILLSVQQQIF
ncbi:hypothetical protein HYV50_05240 [Candidatus Pacearchaeota archaeon]|nr:hypothetical protein [Candidatus Pacearchaeota archaeon]